MAITAITINGLPGAGKTTLAQQLAAELELPLISKDAIKEAITDSIHASLPSGKVGALASETLWKIAGMLPDGVILESFWLAGRDDDFYLRGLATAGITTGVEIWCDIPVTLAHRRYLSRDRHPIHDDASRAASDWDEWATHAQPLAQLPVLRVDTAHEVDIALLGRRLGIMLAWPEDIRTNGSHPNNLPAAR